MTPRSLLLTVALPAAVAGAMLMPALISRRTPGAGAPVRRRWTLPLASGAAYVTGARLVLGRWPPLPPVQAADWLVYLGIAATALGIAASAAGDGGDGRRGRAWVAAAGAVLLCAAIIALPLRTAVERLMGTGTERGAWIAGVAALVLTPWAMAAKASRRLPDVTVPLAMLGVAAASAAAMVLGGNAKLGQIESLLVIGAAWMVAAALVRRGLVRGATWLVPLMSLHAATWLIVGFYSEMSRAAVVVGMVAPGVTAAGLVPPVARMKEPWRSMVVVGASWAVAGVTLLGAEGDST